MRIGYTIWKASDLNQIQTLLGNIAPHVDYFTIVIPFTINSHGVLRIRREPFIRFPWHLTKLAPWLSDTKKPIWIKAQLHPDKTELPSSYQPDWWPGYIQCSGRVAGIILKALAQSLILGFESRGIAVEGCVFGTELPFTSSNRFIKQMEIFNRWLKRKKKDYIKVTYGSNFWQPLRWRYSHSINFFYWWGFGPYIIKALLKGSPYKNADAKKLAEIAYNSYRAHTRHVWELGDYIGLSAYYYPSMQSEANIESAYRRSKFGWFYSYSYPSVVKEWADHWGKPLMVTESGVLYNAPLALIKDKSKREKAITKWYLATFQEFEQIGSVNFTIWEDHESMLCLEALKEYRGVQ